MTSSNGIKVHIDTLHQGIGRLEKAIQNLRTEIIGMIDKQDIKIKENSKMRMRVKIYDVLVPILFLVIGYLVNGAV